MYIVIKDFRFLELHGNLTIKDGVAYFETEKYDITRDYSNNPMIYYDGHQLTTESNDAFSTNMRVFLVPTKFNTNLIVIL